MLTHLWNFLNLTQNLYQTLMTFDIKFPKPIFGMVDATLKS